MGKRKSRLRKTVEAVQPAKCVSADESSERLATAGELKLFEFIRAGLVPKKAAEDSFE